MPIHCNVIGDRRSPTEAEEDEECCIWQETPDSLLLHIFYSLDAHSLVSASQTCKTWHRVAQDESLWRNLMYIKWGVKGHRLALGKRSWQAEYKRLYYHAPTELSENLTLHSDEVLHVSFSHRGDMFSTTSKDATIKVWNVGYPTTQKFSQDFRELLSWDFTQFSCFNASDSMLLVSSVKTTDYLERRGYVAILSLLQNFEILRVVSMDPSQLFGAWLDSSHFLGGFLEISLDRFATTVQIEAFDMSDHEVPLEPSKISVEEGLGCNLFTFSSETASLIKFLTVANVPSRPPIESPSEFSSDSACKTMEDTSDSQNFSQVKNHELCYVCKGCEEMDGPSPSTSANINYSACTCDLPSEIFFSDMKDEAESSRPDCHLNKNLIFVTGDFAVALHQLGIKNVSPSLLESKQRESREDIMDSSLDGDYDQEEQHMVVTFCNNDIQLRHVRKSDKPDHLIDLYGHVTGLCLSHDHRYLFLNCRPWHGNVDRSDPWATPDLSTNIEIRVIDLWTMKDTGVQYVGHKGFSKSTMCCFVFLDVSLDYVGSGSEDAKGYLWDRHYAVNLTTYEHPWGVVNAVGFNPQNQEYLVTVCDDKVIKIWRSRSEMKKYNIPPPPPIKEIENSESTVPNLS